MIENFSLINGNKKLNVKNVEFSVILNGGKKANLRYDVNFDEQKITINGYGDLFDSIVITAVDGGVCCHRTIKNDTNKDILLKELKVAFNGIDLGKDAKKDYFYCNENNRLYGLYTLPLDYDRLNDTEENKKFGITLDKRWVDPDAINDRILNSPYQSFPAIHLGNYDCDFGIIHGTLCQDVFFHNYNVGHAPFGAYLEAYSAFKSIGYRILKAGESLTDKWFLGVTLDAGDVNRLFNVYTEQLRKVLFNCTEKNNINRNSVVWGSWNDGVYRDVSQELLLAEAKALKENFENVTWLQLDDGYATYCAENVDDDAHGIGVVYEGEDGVDKRKFPNGLKEFADKVKELGMHPAIWVGGFCPHATKIYKERPEWFIDYSYRVTDSSPLDVSLPEVREYMVGAIDKFFNDWGFEGVKHDFWSYAFEDSKDLLKNKDKSGYEYRKWWLTQIRKRLPNGYMQTGCDLCMGNPFLSEFFDNYRFGLDVGAGNWLNVKTTLFWGCACFMTHMGDLFIPNGDSIGLMHGLSDSDFIFLLNYLLITHSFVELSGLFSKGNVNKQRLEILKKVTKGLNNGASVYFANFDYRKKGAYIPQIMYSYEKCFDDCDFDKQIICTVAVFNPDEENSSISFTAKDLNLDTAEYVFVDAWNKQSFVTNELSVNLKSHESKLIYVCKNI